MSNGDKKKGQERAAEAQEKAQKAREKAEEQRQAAQDKADAAKAKVLEDLTAKAQAAQEKADEAQVAADESGDPADQQEADDLQEEADGLANAVKRHQQKEVEDANRELRKAQNKPLETGRPKPKPYEPEDGSKAEQETAKEELSDQEKANVDPRDMPTR